MNLEQELHDYIAATHLPGEDPDNLQPDDDLLDSGILDSFAIMQLVSHLEQAYSIVVHLQTSRC